MRLFTSYYSKVARSSTDALLIRVSNTKPDWFSKPLATLSVDVFPTWDIINAFKNGYISYETFCDEYRSLINARTTPDIIYHEIESLAEHYGKEDVVLLCWEKDGDFCHRTELARMLSGYRTYIGEL